MGSDHLADATKFEQPKRWISGARAFAYATVLALLFGLAAGEIGIVSYLFQRNGNGRDPTRFFFPSNRSFHTVGLVLCWALVVLLFCIGSYWCPPIPALFVLFAIMAMSVSSGAVLASNSLTKASSCEATTWGTQFDMVKSTQCKYYSAMAGLSWATFGISLILLGALAFDFFRKTNKKRTVFGA